MRGLGGFFIRRKLDRSGKKDHLYRAVLHTVRQIFHVYISAINLTNVTQVFVFKLDFTKTWKSSCLIDFYNFHDLDIIMKLHILSL